MGLWPSLIHDTFHSSKTTLDRQFLEYESDQSYHRTQAAVEEWTLAHDPTFSLFINGGIGRRTRAVRRALVRTGFPVDLPVLLIEPTKSEVRTCPFPVYPCLLPGVCCQ
jgi:hypothetical protein